MSSGGWFDFDGNGKSSAIEEFFTYKAFRGTSGSGYSSASHFGRAKPHPAELPEQKPIETLTKEECLKEIRHTKSSIRILLLLSFLFSLIPVWLVIGSVYVAVKDPDVSIIAAFIIVIIFSAVLCGIWHLSGAIIKMFKLNITAMHERYDTLEAQRKAEEKKDNVGGCITTDETS